MPTSRLALLAATTLSALTLSLLPGAAPAAPAPAPPDPADQLQRPLALDRGAAPRVVSMVGNTVRFPGGRTVRFTPPAGTEGQARLIGTWRRDALVWAPTGERRATAYRIRPGGAVAQVGEPVLDLYRGGVEWQVAGDTLWIATSDDRFRTRLTKLDLRSGKVLRQRITQRDHLLSLLDATPERALLSEGAHLRVWRGDGRLVTTYRAGSRRFGDASFGSLEHDWFALRTGSGTELRRLSRPGRVVWKDGFENEMLPFDLSGDGSVLLTTEFETMSPQLRDARTGRILRSYSGGYGRAFNDNEQLVLEGSRAFLVVMNMRIDGKHREVLVRCTIGGDCMRASRVAAQITLQTYDS